MCKEIVTPYGQAPRNCRAPEVADGWCRIHHPDTLESELVRDLQRAKREAQSQENTNLGAWVRLKHPALFEQMLDEMEKQRAANYRT